MSGVEVKRDWILRARDRAVLTAEERKEISKFVPASNVHSFDVALDVFPPAFWRAMLDDAKLSPNARAIIALHVFGMRETDLKLEQVYETVVSTPVEFGSTLHLTGARSPNCEMFINGRWYPVIATVNFVEDEEKWTRVVQVSSQIALGEQKFTVHYHVGREMFTSERSEETTLTVRQILEKLGLRGFQTPVAHFNLRLVKAERCAAGFGRVVLVTGAVIRPSRFSWWNGFESVNLGSEEMPSRCIIEPVLEVEDGREYYYGSRGRNGESQSRLPFVRIFCLETKSYAYADIDDISDYEFDTKAMSRLHLPADMHSILKRVFSTPVEKMFGDLLRGKHGGVVILASGEPGVGKTLTAEIYAESNERPLYVLELGELGTSAASVEQNLQTVFARVTRWNAVLQFDECEIFLTKRGTDLERSAIVGIFLRLLDYYRGLLFLTTNRPEMLDDAVISRVMLRLSYPHLDTATRESIWRTMFSVANLEIPNCEFSMLAGLDLNGRQIRNLTRLAKILHPEGSIDSQGLAEALRFGCGENLGKPTIEQ